MTDWKPFWFVWWRNPNKNSRKPSAVPAEKIWGTIGVTDAPAPPLFSPSQWLGRGGWRAPPLVGHWQDQASANSGGPGPNSCDPHQRRLSPGPGSEAALGPDHLGLPEKSRGTFGDKWCSKLWGGLRFLLIVQKMYQLFEYSSSPANQVISHICVTFFFPHKGQANLRFSSFGCDDEHWAMIQSFFFAAEFFGSESAFEGASQNLSNRINFLLVIGPILGFHKIHARCRAGVYKCSAMSFLLTWLDNPNSALKSKLHTFKSQQCQCQNGYAFPTSPTECRVGSLSRPPLSRPSSA